MLFSLVLCSCDSHRHLRIESNMAAEVSDWGGNRLSTPCTISISRETCWLFDSSSGYVIITARSLAGISLRSMAIPTCSVTDGMRIIFSFPHEKSAQDCAVILYDGGREVSRLSCEDALNK
jgi:hypothetical protein